VLESLRRPFALSRRHTGLAANGVLVIGAVAFISLAAQLQIPLPFSPVPVTGQTFAVLVTGAVLGARLGAASTALYLVGGAIGFPIFAGASAGLSRVTGPTGGYLVGFIVAAFVVGLLAKRGSAPWRTASAMVVGQVVIYAFGLAWLSRFPLPIGLPEAGLYPFLVGDVYKLVLAVAAVRSAWRFA
jgi:biotin transport system substrate-specific component